MISKGGNDLRMPLPPQEETLPPDFPLSLCILRGPVWVLLTGPPLCVIIYEPLPISYHALPPPPPPHLLLYYAYVHLTLLQVLQLTN